MGRTPHQQDPRITRLTISGGKRAEPRLMMAHPSWRKRDYRLAAAFVLAVIVIIAIAGSSRAWL